MTSLTSSTSTTTPAPVGGTNGGDRSRGRRTEPAAQVALVRATAVSLLAALLVLAAGGASVLSRSTVYEASVDVLVSPTSGASEADAAALFDSLSKGQVAATAAEIYRQHQWQGTRNGSIEAGVVTPSAVVQVSARSSSAPAAQELVKAVVAAAGPTINRTLDPYQVSRLDSEDPAVARVGLSRGLQLGLVLLAALVVGGGLLRLTHPKPKTSTD
jgi:capsular polysaccharide biosynthesis protein